MKAFKEKYETPGFVMTPEEAKMAKKQIEVMLAERRKEKTAIKAPSLIELKMHDDLVQPY